MYFNGMLKNVLARGTPPEAPAELRHESLFAFVVFSRPEILSSLQIFQQIPVCFHWLGTYLFTFKCRL